MFRVSEKERGLRGPFRCSAFWKIVPLLVSENIEKQKLM